ncbi:MAG TPA: hypothetical protein VMF91_26795 [Bryobacteraceae bacterium]|nr:hypothetical protein [Bryobacteraceae bacterium]
MQIRQKNFQLAAGADIAHLFLHLFDAPDLEKSFAAGTRWVQTEGNLLGSSIST